MSPASVARKAHTRGIAAERRRRRMKRGGDGSAVKICSGIIPRPQILGHRKRARRLRRRELVQVLPPQPIRKHRPNGRFFRIGPENTGIRSPVMSPASAARRAHTRGIAAERRRRRMKRGGDGAAVKICSGIIPRPQILGHRKRARRLRRREQVQVLPPQPNFVYTNPVLGI